MRQDNYMSLSVVVGFFLGIIGSILKFESPELIILGTIVCTVVIYLITTCCVSFYLMFIDCTKTKISRDKLDSTLNYYRGEFDKREKEISGVREYIKHSIKSLNEESEKH